MRPLRYFFGKHTCTITADVILSTSAPTVSMVWRILTASCNIKEKNISIRRTTRISLCETDRSLLPASLSTFLYVWTVSSLAEAAAAQTAGGKHQELFVLKQNSTFGVRIKKPCGYFVLCVVVSSSGWAWTWESLLCIHMCVCMIIWFVVIHKQQPKHPYCQEG